MLRGTLALMTRGLRFDCRRWQMHALRFLLVAVLPVLPVHRLDRKADALDRHGSRAHFFFWSDHLHQLRLHHPGGDEFLHVGDHRGERGTDAGPVEDGRSQPAWEFCWESSAHGWPTRCCCWRSSSPSCNLAVTLGGSCHRQIQATYITLAGYIVLMAGLGLFWASVIARPHPPAVALMVSTAIWLPLLRGVAADHLTSSGQDGPG